MGTMNNASCCNLLPCMNELGRKLYGVALDGAYMERLRGSGCWSRHLCLRCCCLHLTPWGWRCWAQQWLVIGQRLVVECLEPALSVAGHSAWPLELGQPGAGAVALEHLAGAGAVAMEPLAR